MQKSKKPEKIVEADVMNWLTQKGFSCDVIESKAVFSQKANRYLRGQTTQGMSDIVGCDSIGRCIYVELKAKGKRNNISLKQYVFLKEKIKHFAFAVVVDSSFLLEIYYNTFCEFILERKFTEAREYLYSLLPNYED